MTFRFCCPKFTWIACAITLVFHPAPAFADLIAIDPFTGTASDNFNQYNQNMAVQSLPVFDGAGALENLSQDGSIKVEFSSTFGGDQVLPISGMMVGQLGIAQWVFDTPVTRFGGMWENNSGQDDATLVFYDASDAVIGEMIADVPAAAEMWTWNGWESDTPIARIVVTGNGFVNGFLWYENMQIDVVPAPAPFVGLALLFVRARRRSGRTATQ